ncbi:MAG: IclR family transcriptional regulator [Actinobacteria bacterium]|nr:IclR family transcriptional regulator [Actinomycetota bacterium]
MGDQEHQKVTAYKISSLERGLQILELLSGEPAMSAAEVAHRLGLNRATAHRFLAALLGLGYLGKDANARYRVSTRLFELGMRMASRNDLRTVAHPHLLALSQIHRETVNLGQLDGGEVVHIDKVDSDEVLRVDVPIGSRAPAHCVALGKAILSVRSDIALSNLLLQQMTDNTIIDHGLLARELESIRERGYAVDNEEYHYGLRCVAVPIVGIGERAEFAISISAPKMRMSDERVDTIQQDLRAASASIAAELRSAQ